MENAIKKAAKVALAAIAILGLSQCREVSETSSESIPAPEQIISLDESKLLYDTYTKRRANIIKKYEDSLAMSSAYRKSSKQESEDDVEEKEKFVPARFVDFDYQTIRDYLDYLEQEAKASNTQIHGLRVYLANYPKDSDKKGAGKNNLFIVPTTMAEGEAYGFYIYTDAEGKSEARLIKDRANSAANLGKNQEEDNLTRASVFPSTLINVSSSTLQGGDKSLNLNEGSAGPPPKGDY